MRELRTLLAQLRAQRMVMVAAIAKVDRLINRASRAAANADRRPPADDVNHGDLQRRFGNLF